MANGSGGGHHRTEAVGGGDRQSGGSITRSQEKAYGREALSRAGNQYGTGVRGDHRAKQGLGSRNGECKESGGQRCHRAAAGRNGNRKGTGGAGGPLVESAHRQ